MKKSDFSLPLVITIISLMVIGGIVYLREINDESLNNNKNKLTLLNTAQKIPALKSIIQQNLAKQRELEASNTSGETVLEKERIYTEEELNEMTEENFLLLLKDTQNRLPKLSDIKKLPAGALHRTPILIIMAGRDLGLIKEILKIHESYEKVAIPFYQSCAKNAEGTTPVRALCLTNLVEIKKKNGQGLKMNEYPSQIVQLSKMVTEI